MAKSNKERQAEWRARRAIELSELAKLKEMQVKAKVLFDFKAFGLRLTLTKIKPE
jgi:hypothetical protein